VILYEILTRKPAFAHDLTLLSVIGEIVWKNTRPGIPDAILPDEARLIRDCWGRKPWKRPLFDAILVRLEPRSDGFQNCTRSVQRESP
jgi:hypothetical protein